MNKIVKRFLSSAVAVTAFSMVNVSEDFNIGSIKAYASSYELTDLSMGNVNLYENSNYTKELNNSKSLKDTYYAKLSSDKSKISISADVSDGFVEITKSKSSKNYDLGDDITILTGKTTLYVKVYASEDDKENQKNCKEQYKIIIKRYTSEEEEELKNDDQGKGYLETLELDYGDIPLGFRFDKMKYDVTVDSDVKELAIKAQPEDGAYKVTINGITVDENDDYKKKINLSNGTTAVKITLSYDEEDARTYTINITKKDKNSDSISGEQENENSVDNKIDNVQGSGQATDSNNKQESSVKVSGWNKSSDKWSYVDDYGNLLKNTWFYDRNYGKTYYFNNDGIMNTGWIQLNGDWYYLDTSGAMVTGWKMIGSKWYYLDYNGKMRTGWFQDSNGKFYYLYESSGEMAYNTTINGYKIGSDGAWKKN